MAVLPKKFKGRDQKKTQTDYVLLSYFGLLLLFGLIMLTSASAVIAYDRFGDTYFFIKKQLLLGVLPGIAALLFFAKIPFRFLKKIGMWIFYVAAALLVAVLIPGVGSTLNTGARSWLVIGGFSIQPVEIMKLGIIFFLATHFSVLKEGLHELKEGFFLSVVLGLAPVALVVLQPDLGSALILFGIVFAMLFIANAKSIHLMGLGAAAVAAAVVLILIAPYRAARLTTFLQPELDPQGIGYHINQAFVAIGSGGFFGTGLGNSQQKFQYLPEVHADSIFAIIAEELGFFMAVGVLVLLLLITFRALRLAKGATDDYTRYVISGIIVWFMVQSFFNIAAMVGLMPITGVPLPFVSHGGTALFIALAAVGVLANLSRRCNRV